MKNLEALEVDNTVFEMTLEKHSKGLLQVIMNLKKVGLKLSLE